jgi:hypothetical protein
MKVDVPLGVYCRKKLSWTVIPPISINKQITSNRYKTQPPFTQ